MPFAFEVPDTQIDLKHDGKTYRMDAVAVRHFQAAEFGDRETVQEYEIADAITKYWARTNEDNPLPPVVALAAVKAVDIVMDDIKKKLGSMQITP